MRARANAPMRRVFASDATSGAAGESLKITRSPPFGRRRRDLCPNWRPRLFIVARVQARQQRAARKAAFRSSPPLPRLLLVDLSENMRWSARAQTAAADTRCSGRRLLATALRDVWRRRRRHERRAKCWRQLSKCCSSATCLFFGSDDRRCFSSSRCSAATRLSRTFLYGCQILSRLAVDTR